MSEKPNKVTTSRALIWSGKPGQGASIVTDRGVDWVVTTGCAVRADALRSLPKCERDVTPGAFRSMRARALRTPEFPASLCRGEMRGFGLIDGRGRVLSVRGLYVCLNKTVADEWFRHDWHSVTVCVGGAVLVREKRRGKPVVVAMLMPLYPGGYLTFDGAAA